MSKLSLSVKQRTETGKIFSKKVRQADGVVGVVYGGDKEPVPVTLDRRVLEKLLRNEYGKNAHITLQIETEAGKTEEEQVVICDLQRDAISLQILHVDFFRADDKTLVKAVVPIKLTGVCPGLKMGGVLVQKCIELKVQCLPTQIPVSYDIDLSTLGLGEFLSVEDFQKTLDYKVLSHPKDIIVRIAAPRVQVDTEADAAEEGADSAEEAAAEPVAAES